MTKRLRRGYGWNPDRPDQRDMIYSAVAPVPLPESVDMRPLCPPVVDQGALGSCTANALAGAVGFLEMKDKVPFVPVSRLFVYYNERLLEHTTKSDSGAIIRDGIKTLKAQGACAEALWPYVIAKFTRKPKVAAYTAAAKHKIYSYARLTSLASMQQCLAGGFPFVFGFTVYDSFESSEVAQTGVVPMPAPGEQVLGGHAVLAVGYDLASGRFIVRNSWGTGWGQAGYFTIPFAYLVDPNLADDFWTVRRERGF